MELLRGSPATHTGGTDRARWSIRPRKAPKTSPARAREVRAVRSAEHLRENVPLAGGAPFWISTGLRETLVPNDGL